MTAVPHGSHPTLHAFAVLLLVCAGMLAVPLAGDQLLLRRWYVHWLEPESTAGMTMLAPLVVAAQWRSDRPNVLVVGDSRVAEGFSAAAANASAAGQALNFIWLGMPGTTPRIWSLLLRCLDPRRSRFAGIYLMATTLRDSEVQEDLANRTLDNAYLAPLLGLSDLPGYAGSFSDAEAARQARDAVLFPASTLQSDLGAFLRSPRHRLEKVRQWRAAYAQWQRDYPGQPGDMPPVTGHLDRDGVLAQLVGDRRRNASAYFDQAGHRAEDGGAAAREYRERWYGGIAARYAGSPVQVGVFLVPRGPYHTWLDQPAGAQGALAALQARQALRLLPVDSALALERPQYFFDTLHLNARGRAEFSASLAAAVAQDLGRDAR